DNKTIMNLLKTLLIFCVSILVSCNNSTQKETSENQAEPKNIKSNSKDPIVFTINGKTRTISANEREANVADFEESPIRYLFRKKTIKGEKSQFEIDFVFSDKENLSELPKTYDLTGDPSLQLIASLSFFDF